jgi:hypothetical protein
MFIRVRISVTGTVVDKFTVDCSNRSAKFVGVTLIPLTPMVLDDSAIGTVVDKFTVDCSNRSAKFVGVTLIPLTPMILDDSAIGMIAKGMLISPYQKHVPEQRIRTCNHGIVIFTVDYKVLSRSIKIIHKRIAPAEAFKYAQTPAALIKIHLALISNRVFYYA